MSSSKISVNQQGAQQTQKWSSRRGPRGYLTNVTEVKAEVAPLRSGGGEKGKILCR